MTDDCNNTAKLHPGETQERDDKCAPYTPELPPGSSFPLLFQFHSDSCFPQQEQNFSRTKPDTSALAAEGVKALQTLPS